MSRGLVIDLFAGGGGASLALELALGRPVDVAVNHDPVAVAVHRLNHPETLHYQASVWEAKPDEVTGGRPVDVLWASPDCTHHSRAKGGKPRKRDRRVLADVVIRWAALVRPRLIFLENVSEFREWGPLNGEGQPCKKLAGIDFRRWVSSLERLGYAVEWRLLDASLYGAPTKRERLFIVARCDGQAIEWPAPTHGPGLLPLRAAAECIDWTIPCPSIFERKRPLAEKTLWRIAQGTRRFVLEAAAPFIVKVNHGGMDARVNALSDPLSTVTASRRGHALVAAFLNKHFKGVVGQEIGKPASTITARDHHSPTAVHLVKLRGDCHSASAAEPAPTITASGCHVGEVRAFLTKYYGQGVGQDLREPAHTITARHRLGLVTIAGANYQISDIGMRMLKPAELLRAQFGEYAARYSLEALKRCPRTKKRVRMVPIADSDKVRMVGNSVCPHVALALIKAQLRGAEEVAA